MTTRLPRFLLSLLPVILLLSPGPAARAQETIAVSVNDSGVTGDGSSGSEGVDVAIDASGHLLVVFCSYATDLVAGDTNGVKDVFLLDRTTGVLELVSVDVLDGPADDGSFGPGVSLDGRYVVFSSRATDLMKSGVDGNGEMDVFVRDRARGYTHCVSVDSGGQAGDGESFAPFFNNAISYDGRYVLFGSEATDLVSRDTNGVEDVFLRDLTSGTTKRLSVDEFGKELAAPSYAQAFSTKASVALFTTTDAAVLSGFSNGAMQCYAYVRSTGELLPAAARADGTALQTDYRWLVATITGDDGSDFDPLVAFVTTEDEVIPGDGDATYDLYVRRLRGGEVQQATLFSDGSPSYWGNVFAPSLAPDGSGVAFMTRDAFESPPDSGIEYDVYYRGLRWTLFEEYGIGLAGSGGFVPHFSGRGGSCEDGGYALHVADGLGGAFGLLWVGLGSRDQSLFGGHFYVDFAAYFFAIPFVLGGAAGVAGDGSLDLDGANAEALVGTTVYGQCMVADVGAVKRIALSNALEIDLVDVE